jgi:uncharacterized protein YbjT (DUF2867 family)
MRVTIFGSTGAAGQLLVKACLDAGHHVTAFARSPEKLPPRSDRLRVVKGTLADAEAIDEAVRDSNAVVSLLGPMGRSKGTPITNGMRLIVAATRKHGVKRLIATATPSASDPNDRF